MEMSRKAICPRLREGPRSVRPRGIDVAVTHSLVMPGLGPGIHEFRGHPRYECRWNGPFPCAELVDARPKAWHDGVGHRRLRPAPDSHGPGSGIHEFPGHTG